MKKPKGPSKKGQMKKAKWKRPSKKGRMKKAKLKKLIGKGQMKRLIYKAKWKSLVKG